MQIVRSTTSRLEKLFRLNHLKANARAAIPMRTRHADAETLAANACEQTINCRNSPDDVDSRKIDGESICAFRRRSTTTFGPSVNSVRHLYG
jgi:hypothetical protein